MFATSSIFLDFRLPNATTWSYFSIILAVALFFKFTRLLSMRNWDVVTLFLLVPGLLLIREAHARGGHADLLLWLGYLWLMAGSAYFLVRCFIDLGLIRRPALTPNLNLAGLAWLGGALFLCLVMVAVQHRESSPGVVGKPSVGLKELENNVEKAADGILGSEGPFWVRCSLALVCHAVVVAGLIVIGCRHFQDAHAGMAAAAFYLLLPYTGMHVEQVHHVWPTAFIVWAVAAYRLPTLAGLLLGLAAGAAYFPALLFPLWLSFYWRRGTGRFTAAFVVAAGLSLALVAAFLWMDGRLMTSLHSALNLCDWQPWRRPSKLTEGFWLWTTGQGVHWAYRIPIFVAYMAFVVTTAFWPAPKNLAHLLALSAAALIGIQFWYSDQGGVYVLWYLPLLLLLVFRPNLADRRPLTIQPETDWLVRFARPVNRLVLRVIRLPQPLTRVR